MTTATVKEDPTTTAERLIGRRYVSHSALSTYRACPLKFFFRYVENLPERFVSSSLAFGGALHAAVEVHFRELLAGNPPPDLDVLLSGFWDAWRWRTDCEVRFNKGEDINTIGFLAERMLVPFQTSKLARPQGVILGVEEELRGKVVPGVPDLLARVDLITEDANALSITDFKTARSRWSRQHVHDASEQLLLYGELARELAPHKPLRLQFAVITKAKSPAVEVYGVAADAVAVQRTKRVVERVWRAIKGGHFFPAPSPLNCPSCPFQGPCRAWQG